MWTASCDSGQTPATQNTREQHPVILVLHLQQHPLIPFKHLQHKIHVNSILWFRSNTCNRKYMWTGSCDSCTTPATENAWDEGRPVIIAQHLQHFVMNGILWFLSHISNNKYKWTASCDSGSTPATEEACDERHLAILVKHLQQFVMNGTNSLVECLYSCTLLQHCFSLIFWTHLIKKYQNSCKHAFLKVFKSQIRKFLGSFRCRKSAIFWHASPQITNPQMLYKVPHNSFSNSPKRLLSILFFIYYFELAHYIVCYIWKEKKYVLRQFKVRKLADLRFVDLIRGPLTFEKYCRVYL